MTILTYCIWCRQHCELEGAAAYAVLLQTPISMSFVCTECATTDPHYHRWSAAHLRGDAHGYEN